MTDQDPTQPFDAPPPPPACPPPAPPATFAPAAQVAPDTAPVPLDAMPVATAPVATTPVAAARRPGRSPIRWLLAAVVTLAVAGTAAAATLLLTGSSGDPAVLAWTPKQTVAYTELRLDLPGDQSAELAKVMQAFPGFDDQAAFPTKLNEALDQLVKGATDGKQSYTEDIAPWFGGQISVSVGALPKAGDASNTRVLLLISTRDAAKAQAWADEYVKQDGATISTETYNGVTITTGTPSGGSSGGM